MSALQVNEFDVLRDTLKDEVTLTAHVGAGISARIVWEWMNEAGEEDYPYIKCIYMSGGSANDAKGSDDSDSMWKVVGVTASQPETRTLANAINEALKNVMPITTNVADVESYTPIQEIMPIYESYKVNNIPIYEVGALFRLRLYLN